MLTLSLIVCLAKQSQREVEKRPGTIEMHDFKQRHQSSNFVLKKDRKAKISKITNAPNEIQTTYFVVEYVFTISIIFVSRDGS